ncbi:MAG: GreA/GreB family elongation factor [Candidatus Omnitrophica bacterium]|nr:GreA/GreB family elongation factor [Candidatus Omnitrophota bacterium]MDD5670738.1 GreA/GreB family elongation factor [Candidatus Omnitrophota bacterium]
MRNVTSEIRTLIAKADLERLRHAIAIVREVSPSKEELLAHLEQKLANVEAINAEKVPKDIVTMNSVVRLLWLDTEEINLCWLGFPGALNYDGHKVSILSPLGIALLGTKVGEIAEQAVPNGVRRFKVIEIIYQPEAMKDFHL